MADDVKPEVIKKTQDLLGKYFKKPPLTEKLLKKPPFRFLHDIVSVVIRETGFLDGLYTEHELNSENINNKEAKLAYLTKLIDVVKLTTGANLTVRASKIISGQEPTKTNELLQTIGKALDKKINSAEAIEHYKRNLEIGKSTVKGKSSARKEEKKTSSKEISQKRVTPGKDRSSDRRKKISTENHASKNDLETHKSENQESQTKVEGAQASVTESSRDKVSSSAHRRKTSSAKPKPSISNVPPSETTPSQENANIDKKVDENRKQKEIETKSKQTTYNENNESLKREQNVSDTIHLGSKSINNVDNKVNESTENMKAERNENEVINHEIFSQNEEKSDSVTLKTQKSQLENSDISLSQSNNRPKTSLRPPSARPISARPAAPRLRGKPELIVNEEILTPMGNISVIVENSETKEDDDAEDMVVMETRGGGDSLENNGTFKVDDQLTQEHGHLVAQILETQKELVNHENVDVIPKKTNIAWDTSTKRDVVIKEVDKLRNTIQTLTRATNPLGKLFDYFQEDVEIMQKELLEWRHQHQQLNEQLKIEKLKTQELIEPMKETLKEIDQNMKVQLDKICQAKAQIMKNDQRIQTLLNGRV
ncbi:PREDICTED: TRAF3-interacting protein 1 [Dufourea novaeangliae]|uniref:TRAF3-interacting protein 1 n=1 Tax=Dufourea novaeangliae TaxID=178035 RepID=A0A154P5L0_DUFNO|nr:PREDICTED: TRAF3-interacting protein 1 [Dufourea novaeangliae]KZC06478.1 TRAF3-interacting protein 1 [Dufourea novaeangliae]